jgi:tRNA threonylcarbamoyladenosine biosynthesis protein TsaB
MDSQCPIDSLQYRLSDPISYADTQALVIDSDSFKDYLDKQPIYFMGNGADKCVETIQHPNAHFIKNIVPRAKNMIPLAEMAMAKEQFEDVAYFEPFYLKEFVATKSKKLL